MNKPEDFVDGMPVECGGIGDDGRPILGVTLDVARARIEEGISRGRLMAALWELPDGNVAVALADPHATPKLVDALRRTADGLARTTRAH